MLARPTPPPVDRVKHLAELSGRWLSEWTVILDRSMDALDPGKCGSVERATAELREGEASVQALHAELVAAMQSANPLEQEEALSAALADTESYVAYMEAAMDQRVPRLRAFHASCPHEAKAVVDGFQVLGAKFDGIDALRKPRTLTVEAGRIGCLRFAVPPGFEAERTSVDAGEGWRLKSPLPNPAFPDEMQEFQVWGFLQKSGTTLEQVTAKQEALWERKRLPEDAPATKLAVVFDGGFRGLRLESTSGVPGDGRWLLRRTQLAVMHRATLYQVMSFYNGPADGGSPLDAPSDALFGSVSFDCGEDQRQPASD